MYFHILSLLHHGHLFSTILSNKYTAFVLYAIMMSYGEKMFEPIPWPCCDGQSDKSSNKKVTFQREFKEDNENDDGSFSA